MVSYKKRRRKALRIWIVLPIALIMLLMVGILAYLKTGYEADAVIIQQAEALTHVDITKDEDVTIIGPSDAETAFIFYPGGKVAAQSYEPLLIKLAEQGIFCIMPTMPFNLAVLDSNAAERYMDDGKGIKHWYIGGHSLGGSMAAVYASKHASEFEGLILLASYSTSDVSESGLEVLSLYGSEDKVLNLEAYTTNLANLPADRTEIVIEGGNHAGFGSYGAQKGDGLATLTQAAQQDEAVEAIVTFITANQ